MAEAGAFTKEAECGAPLWGRFSGPQHSVAPWGGPAGPPPGPFDDGFSGRVLIFCLISSERGSEDMLRMG